MNYDNEEDEKRDEGKPVIGKPAAAFKKSSAFGKTSAFSRAAGNIRERFKNLSKKDIAFVVVGMGVLVMAPVAEYLMSKPAGADQLMPGFGQRSEGSGPLYEPGINALSQGSPDGSGEIITPLSARDPASLIIGSQPSPPPAAPQLSSPPKTDFRDSMKDSARAAFTQATKAAGAPTVIPKMQSSLRGLGSLGGEGSRTSGSLSGGKILKDARNASGRAASRSMVGPVATAGYKGVATRVPNSANKGAFEKLRGQADRAAGSFSGASAIRSLDRAAAASAALGGAGGSAGEKNRPPSGSSIRDTRNSSGESLEQMAAKQRMQKALEWEFYKQYEIPKMIIASVLGSLNGVSAEFIKRRLNTALGMDPASSEERFCWSPANDYKSGDREDCQKYGAIGESFLRDKGEKQSSTANPPGRSCACGYNSVCPSVGKPVPAKKGCGDAPPLPVTPAATPEPRIPEAKDFDTALVSVLARIQEVVKKGEGGIFGVSPGELLGYNKGISKTLAEEMPKLVATLNSSLLSVNKLSSGDVEALNMGNDSSEMPLIAAESDTSDFINEVTAVLGAGAGEYAKKVGGDLTADSAVKADISMNAGGELEKKLALRLKSAQSLRDVQLGSARKHLAFNGKSYKFYSQQGTLISGRLAALRDRAEELSRRSKAVADEAEAIPADSAAQSKDVICREFAELSGISVCAGTAAPEKGTGIADSLMALRGADGVVENALDDKKAVEAEALLWRAASPREKLGNDTFDSQTEALPELQENISACILRANKEFPADAAVLVKEPEVSVKGPAEAVSGKIKEYRKELGLAGSASAPARAAAPAAPVRKSDPGYN